MVPYVGIRNRNPLSYKFVKQKNKVNGGPSYEDRENEIMMINITMKTYFPSVFMMNSYTYQTTR